MSASSTYYGVQVRCPLLRRTARRCCCPPRYIKRSSTVLCFAFIHIHTYLRTCARAERRGSPSQPPCVTLSLVCFLLSYSGFIIELFVLLLSLFFHFLSFSHHTHIYTRAHVRELLPLRAYFVLFLRLLRFALAGAMLNSSCCLFGRS